jgi:drug/metabolite transporter (DMT)-like permease
VLFGVMSAVSYLPLYRAFGKGQVSLISPIFASFAGVVVVLSAVFFGETIPGGQWLAIAIIFLGVLLISTDPRDLVGILRGREAHPTKGLPEVLAALAMYSVWLVLLDQFLSGRDWVFFLLVIRSVAALTLFIYARATGQSLAVPDRQLRPFLALIGLCDVAAFSLVSYGFSQSSHTSIVAVLSSTFSVPTLILAAVFLHERINRLQKVAAAIILCGIVLVSVL